VATARIGVYPRKRIPTVDVYPGGPGGPLARFVTDDIFVSAVGVPQVESRAGASVLASSAGPAPERTGLGTSAAEEPGRLTAVGGASGGVFGRVSGAFVSFGAVVGSIVNTFLAAGRQTIELTLHTILPFMAYVSLLLGIVNYTGIATGIANVLSPIATNPLGLIAIAVITAMPFLSPILGPGRHRPGDRDADGRQIAIGALPVQYALPTLFAINGRWAATSSRWDWRWARPNRRPSAVGRARGLAKPP